MTDVVSNTKPTISVVPVSTWGLVDFREIRQYRELLFFLAWRDIKVRYKQSVLGAAWALIQPFTTMLLFSFIFGRLLHVQTGDVPYPIFSYTALLPWQLFAFSLTNSSNSLVNDKNLISKIYFPRLIVPLSSVVAGLADFSIAFLLLLGMMVFYGIPITLRVLYLPLFVFFVLLSALAVGIWLSALMVKYRDFRYVIPFLTQLWMYATPIAYAVTLIPEKWRAIYALNPMVGVVEGFRWALLGSQFLDVPVMLVSFVVMLVLLISGLVYFRRVEDVFADVI